MIVPPHKSAFFDSKMIMATHVNSPNPVPSGARPLGCVFYKFVQKKCVEINKKFIFYSAPSINNSIVTYVISHAAGSCLCRCWCRWLETVAWLLNILRLSFRNFSIRSSLLCGSLLNWSRNSSDYLIGRCRFRLIARWCLTLTIGFVCSTIKDGIQLISDILSGSTDWPWISIITIATTFAKLSRWHNHTISQRDTEWSLEVIENDRLLRNPTDSSTKFFFRAVHCSCTRGWNDVGGDAQSVVSNTHWWSISSLCSLNCRRLISSLSSLNWGRLISSLGCRRDILTLCRSNWSGSWTWCCWSLSRTLSWSLSWWFQSWCIITGCVWIIFSFRERWQVLVTWNVDDISLFGQNFRCSLSSCKIVIDIRWYLSSFVSVTAANLWSITIAILLNEIKNNKLLWFVQHTEGKKNIIRLLKFDWGKKSHYNYFECLMNYKNIDFVCMGAYWIGNFFWLTVVVRAYGTMKIEKII